MYDYYKKIRDERGMTDYQVAKLAGIPRSTFSDWNNGRSTPKQDKLIRIAEVLDVSVERLITGKDTPKESTSGTTYYFSDETAKAAQEMLENKELRALMAAAQDNSPENIRLATEMLQRFKGTNPDG